MTGDLGLPNLGLLHGEEGGGQSHSLAISHLTATSDLLKGIRISIYVQHDKDIEIKSKDCVGINRIDRSCSII